ncbi:MAG: glutaminyl-peptide cyclotransferase [Bacteroidetes bacterium]|nr:glutaminyl-peptide cyclotransferase [Bacteroidota bacterium]
MKIAYVSLLPVLFVWVVSCSSANKEKPELSPIGYSVHSTLPHDISSFTQGLVVHNGELYESTGQEGSSWVGVIDVSTGKATRKTSLDAQFFGEGITILNGKIYQLTWKNKTGFIYNLATLQKSGSFSYQTEGWGITHNGKDLIMSDGTSRLYFLDTLSFSVKSTLEVKEGTMPVQYLNELEWINGFIYANLWQTNRIVKINPDDGQVVGYMDLSLIADQALSRNPSADVLNGIAWHTGTNSMLVTGKYWPNIFVLRLEATDAPAQ